MFCCSLASNFSCIFLSRFFFLSSFFVSFLLFLTWLDHDSFSDCSSFFLFFSSSFVVYSTASVHSFLVSFSLSWLVMVVLSILEPVLHPLSIGLRFWMLSCMQSNWLVHHRCLFSSSLSFDERVSSTDEVLFELCVPYFFFHLLVLYSSSSSSSCLNKVHVLFNL